MSNDNIYGLIFLIGFAGIFVLDYIQRKKELKKWQEDFDRKCQLLEGLRNKGE